MSFVPAHAPKAPDVERRGMGVRPTMIFGAVVVAMFATGFGGWAAFAPLESAAIAQGTVRVDSKRKTVQHLEGGIIAEILVKEGDEVAAGQSLVVLDDTQARASFSLIEGQYHSTAALTARLQAERDALGQIHWPEWLRQAVNGEDVLVAQERIFHVRATLLENQTAIYKRQIARMREEIIGLKEEIKAQDRQLDLLEEERNALHALVEKGYERKPRLFALGRRIAELSGERARNRAQGARVEQTIGETRLKITELGIARLNQVVEDLREAEARLSDLRERLSAAQHILSRTHVAAPVSGVVVNLRVSTLGGVVSPGEPLMDIVPAGDTLIIEARVEPMDIDAVYPGLPTQVRPIAFSQLTTPVLIGKVLLVSADILFDGRTGTPFYEALVALDPEQLELAHLKLVPGMPVEVMIVTGRTTPLDYLLKPIVTSFRRALREE